MSWATPQEFSAQVILNVCELSGYTSPDDNPELLQCTATELETCILKAFEHFDEARGKPSVVTQSDKP